MNPNSQPPAGVDLAKVRQTNEDSLLTRATTHLAGEVKKGADATVSEAEKLTAGSDLVELAAPAPGSSARKTARPESSSGSSSSPAPVSSDDSSSLSSAEDKAASSSSSGDSLPPPTPPDKPEYTEAEKLLLERMEELNKQAEEHRKMWRKNLMEWYEMQLKWREDLEAFAQATYVLWEEVALARWSQSSKQAEAVRALL